MLIVLLKKEMRLATPALTYCFLAFSLLTFCPGYPILLGAFFICLGIFQAYQTGITNHDLLYSLLLPVGKKQIVAGKFVLAALLEGTGWLLMAIITIVRMVWLNQLPVYQTNQLMSANWLFLAFACLIFAEFNCIFLRLFFKTGKRLLGPFLWFALAAMLTISVAESLHHLPGLAFLNLSRGPMGVQLVCLLAGLNIWAAGSWAACRQAQRSFDQLDF